MNQLTTQAPLPEAVAAVNAALLEGKLHHKTRGLRSLSDELQSLRKAGLSTHTIAREITAAGFPISQTAVWRCLRNSKPKAKAKAKTASPSALSPTTTAVPTAPTTAPLAKPPVAPRATPLDDDAEAAALLAELQEPVVPRRQVKFPAAQTT